MSQENRLEISFSSDSDKPLSEPQKHFNWLVSKIRDAKAELAEAHERLELLKSLLASDVAPVEGRLAEAEEQILMQLDYWLDNSDSFLDKEILELKIWILDRAGRLISKGRRELIPIYNKYADQSYEEQERQQRLELKERVKKQAKDMLGADVQLDENHFDSPEEFVKAVSEQLRNVQKTPSETGNEHLPKDGLKGLKKLMKGIYNALVKKLHPDRAANEEDRQCRNEAMQKLTDAYERGDLFDLLSMKKRHEQADNDRAEDWASEAVADYNQCLRQQLGSLEDECQLIKHPMPPFDHYAAYMQAESLEDMENEILSTKKDLEVDILDANLMLDALQTQESTKKILRAIADKREMQEELIAFFASGMHRGES